MTKWPLHRLRTAEFSERQTDRANINFPRSTVVRSREFPSANKLRESEVSANQSYFPPGTLKFVNFYSESWPFRAANSEFGSSPREPRLKRNRRRVRACSARRREEERHFGSVLLCIDLATTHAGHLGHRLVRGRWIMHSATFKNSRKTNRRWKSARPADQPLIIIPRDCPRPRKDSQLLIDRETFQ